MCLATMAYAYPACPVRVTIFSTGSKFRPVSELHALTLAARSYVLLAAIWNMNVIGWLELYTHVYHKVRVQDLRWHIHNSAIWRQILWCVSHKGESIWHKVRTHYNLESTWNRSTTGNRQQYRQSRLFPNFWGGAWGRGYLYSGRCLGNRLYISPWEMTELHTGATVCNTNPQGGSHDMFPRQQDYARDIGVTFWCAA